MSFDPNAETVPRRSSSRPTTFLNAANFMRDIVNFIFDANDCHIVEEALSNAMWGRYGKGTSIY